MSVLRDDLIAAKALIDTPEKWRKDGEYGYGTGCLCALGACGSVGGSQHLDDNGSSPFRRMHIALRRALPTGYSVPVFNDRPNTTHADIMALFDRAIEAAK